MNGRWKETRLRWKPPLVLVMMVVVVWACVGVHGGSRARLVNNGYEGVVVGVSQNVREEDGLALVEALKEVLAETSRGLFQATERRAYFRSITILIPRSWSSVNVTHQAGSESFQYSDIRVDEMNPVYHHQPYTEQTGGCGDPGLHIHLTPTYLLDDTEANWWGPRGKALLAEWAKLRWGVFDEMGYPGDPTFPLFYKDSEGGISPTHCADPSVRGQRMDQQDRGECRVTQSGEPDKQCRFIPDLNQTASSSLLSDPLIMTDKIIHFCGGGGRKHNAEAPTKQNLYCNRRSVWDVISAHPDFKDGANPPTEAFADVTVRVVQQTDTTYALVLDYSSSMSSHDRVHKLRRTARRWLLHEVAAGSYVAIINFSSNATLVREMTRITDEASRRVLADSIETKVDGSTSIGSGLHMAAKTVLANRRNPVILLITGGEENEHPRIQDVLDDVVTSGARVVTVAFGPSADPKLEKVAEVTGGKTFTVKDIDEGQMLDDAFQGALIFQPPPPTADQTVTIQETEYQFRGSEASSTFSVDFTLGRNLTLRLQTGAQVTSAPVLIGPDAHVYTNVSFDFDSSTWTLMVTLAQEGEWKWKVGLSGQQSNSVAVRVTSQPRDPVVLPITTLVWVNQGAKEVNATVDKVIILAEVKQGNKPVMNADVRAIVTPPNDQDPAQVYKLLDNGQGSDTLAGDGIYSGYMTQYPSSGRYSVKAQVTDGGTALINNGFLTTPRRRRRREAEEHTQEEKEEEREKEEEKEGKEEEEEEKEGKEEKEEKEGKEEEDEEDEDYEMDDSHINRFLNRPPVCCGSNIPVPQDARATGSFHRTVSGGSVKISTVPQSDVLGPAKVRDLQIRFVSVGWVPASLPTNAPVSLTWTAPGDDLDSGMVSGYELRMTTNKSDLLDENFTITDTSNSSSSSSNSVSSSWHVVDLSGLPVDVEGGTTLRLNLSLTLTSPKTYFALRAWDDVNIVSNVSNIAILHLDVAPAQTGERMQTWAVVLVVLVVVGLVCLLVVVAMLYQAKRKRTI